MFLAKIQSQGLPYPDGSIREPDTVFEFSFCLAEENGYRWLMGIEAIREDRVLYLPQSELQGEWVDAQSDLMQPSGIELSWWFRNACSAFEFVERLGACRIGPSLQERYIAGDGDIIAPPPEIAEEMLAGSLAALEQNRHAQAFDIATRLLAGEGFRARARQVRERVLSRFGCFDDAQRERDILALLGEKALPEHPLATGCVCPPISPLHRAVAVELQGLPLDYPAVENHLVRYLYRIDIPRDTVALPWQVKTIEIPYGVSGETIPELPEQETWLRRTGTRRANGIWEVEGEAAQDAFIMALQNGLATTDRWGLLARIKRAQATA